MEPTVILRLRFDDDLFDLVMTWLPSDRVEAAWRRGERRNARAVHESSGANVFLSEREEIEAALAAALAFVQEERELFEDLREGGVEMGLDLGFCVGGQHWTRSARLTPAEAGLLAELRVTFEVSAYFAPEDSEVLE